MAKKQELVDILVEQYGYDKEDLKFDVEGKPYTNAKLQLIINQEEEDAKELESSSTRVLRPRSKIKDDDKIYVMNGLMGTLIYKSERTNRTWEFNTFGQMDTIEYSELVTMRNRYPRFFTEGWLVVLDKDVQDEFKLTDMYHHILTPENIDSVFKKDIDELNIFIDNLPEGMKSTFVNKARDLYENNELDSKKIIDLIEDKFGFSLNDNAPLADIAVKKSDDDNIIIVKGK